MCGGVCGYSPPRLHFIFDPLTKAKVWEAHSLMWTWLSSWRSRWLPRDFASPHKTGVWAPPLCSCTRHCLCPYYLHHKYLIMGCSHCATYCSKYFKCVSSWDCHKTLWGRYFADLCFQKGELRHGKVRPFPKVALYENERSSCLWSAAHSAWHLVGALGVLVTWLCRV